jgi:hypothetical protein
LDYQAASSLRIRIEIRPDVQGYDVPDGEALDTPALSASHRQQKLSSISPLSPAVVHHYVSVTMSGLEIVGVVIGVIPVVVASVKKYRERQSRLSFRSKGPILQRLVQCLETQHFLLVADISVTLSKADVPHDPASAQLIPAIFNDPKISDAVDEYLGDHRAIYYKAVNRCYAALAQLIQSIDGLEPMPVGAPMSLRPSSQLD